MGRSAEELGLTETAGLLRAALDSAFIKVTILDLVMTFAKDGDEEALAVMREVTSVIQARVTKAWADRTEADRKARQAEGIGNRVAFAADRELHDAEYHTLCALLGDQAALERTLR